MPFIYFSHSEKYFLNFYFIKYFKLIFAQIYSTVLAQAAFSIGYWGIVFIIAERTECVHWFSTYWRVPLPNCHTESPWPEKPPTTPDRNQHAVHSVQLSVMRTVCTWQIVYKQTNNLIID